MKRFPPMLTLLLAALLVAFGGAHAQDDGGDRPTVKVGSNVSIPLRLYFEGNEIRGYEYEVYAEALNRAGYDVEVVDVAFAGIFAGLQADKWRVAASNIFITEERAAEMDYSDPYLSAFDALMVREDDDSIDGPEDLEGKVLGTEVGTTQAAFAENLQEEYGPFEIRSYEDPETQVLDLEIGRIDALTLGYPTARVYIEERGMFEIIAQNQEAFMIGAFFREGDELRDEFNAALNEMKRDGTTAELYEQYFGEPPAEGTAPVRVFEEPYVP